MIVQTQNGGVEKELFNQIVRKIQDAPSYENMGMSILNLSSGGARVGMNIKKEFGNTLKHAHGGLIAALVDTAMGLAVATLGFTIITMEININYFLPVNVGEDLIATGFIIHVGKNTAVAEAEIYNFEKSLVAKSRGTFSVRSVS